MFSPRHYFGNSGDARGVFQVDTDLEPHVRRSRGNPMLPESILRLAHEEYAKQCPGQDFERIQQRGGFSLFEIVRLLADHCERLKGGK